MNNTPKNTRDYGGRGRLAFLNYEAFVDRVNADAPKTTDDCYTPADVYEAVYISRLDELHARGKGLFGNALLVGPEKARQKREALEAARHWKQRVQRVQLSEREREITQKL